MVKNTKNFKANRSFFESERVNHSSLSFLKSDESYSVYSHVIRYFERIARFFKAKE